MRVAGALHLSLVVILALAVGCSSASPRASVQGDECSECGEPPVRQTRTKTTVWKPEEHRMVQALTATYETGRAPTNASFLSMKDERDVPLAPRDPGPSGRDGELLLGRPLPTTRFVGASGEVVDLSDFVGKKYVALVILRGFDGAVCMACTGQTLALTQRLDSFRTLDTQVLFVYPGRRDSVNAFLDAVHDAGGAERLPVPVLLDIDLAVVREMKIEDRLAKPTTLILDKQGRVRFAHVGRSKTDRPSVPQLLDVIAKLSSDPTK